MFFPLSPSPPKYICLYSLSKKREKAILNLKKITHTKKHNNKKKITQKLWSYFVLVNYS